MKKHVSYISVTLEDGSIIEFDGPMYIDDNLHLIKGLGIKSIECHEIVKSKKTMLEVIKEFFHK